MIERSFRLLDYLCFIALMALISAVAGVGGEKVIRGERVKG